MKIYRKFLFLILFFLTFSAFANENNDTLPSGLISPINEKLFSNKFIFFDQNGDQKNLDIFEDKLLIIHFWASWLMDCYKDLVALNELQKKFRKKPLLVIAISEDFQGIEKINEFYNQHQIDYLDIYIDKKNKIFEQIKLKHLPSTLIINQEGLLIAQTPEGKNIDWNDEEIINFLENHTKFYKLLPPEYKRTRESFLGQNQ